MEYIQLSSVEYLELLLAGATRIKYTLNGSVMYSSGASVMATFFGGAIAASDIIAVEFDKNFKTTKMNMGDVVTLTAYEVLSSYGESVLNAYSSLPRITKEEFYTL